MAVQGDYFFPLLLSFVSLTIKEISDIVNPENIIMSDKASNVLISHHLPSSEVRWQPHPAYLDYLVLILP